MGEEQAPKNLPELVALAKVQLNVLEHMQAGTPPNVGTLALLAQLQGAILA